MGDRMFDQSLFRILDRVHHRSVHLGEWMTNSMTESEDPSAERSPTPWAGSSSWIWRTYKQASIWRTYSRKQIHEGSLLPIRMSPLKKWDLDHFFSIWPDNWHNISCGTSDCCKSGNHCYRFDSGSNSGSWFCRSINDISINRDGIRGGGIDAAAETEVKSECSCRNDGGGVTCSRFSVCRSRSGCSGKAGDATSQASHAIVTVTTFTMTCATSAAESATRFVKADESERGRDDDGSGASAALKYLFMEL
jgi:hypothetical protein